MYKYQCTSTNIIQVAIMQIESSEFLMLHFTISC